MFIVLCASERMLAEAGSILKNYDTFNSIGPYFVTVEMRDDIPEERAQSELRLCEAEFQMNWHQTGDHLCIACKAEIEKKGEGFDTCGHLTFDRPIRPNF